MGQEKYEELIKKLEGVNKALIEDVLEAKNFSSVFMITTEIAQVIGVLSAYKEFAKNEQES